MRDIKDLEHFVLQEGETLILRTTCPLSPEQLAMMRKMIDRHLPGRPVLVLPPEVQVCAGRLEVMGVPADAPSSITQEEIDVARKEITDAYADGRSIYVQDASVAPEWVMMHKHYNPIAEWDWDGTRYSLTKPKPAR